MMKRLSIRGFKFSSTRRECQNVDDRNGGRDKFDTSRVSNVSDNECPQTCICRESAGSHSDMEYCMSNGTHDKKNRKGLLSTLRKRFSSQRKKDSSLDHDDTDVLHHQVSMSSHLGLDGEDKMKTGSLKTVARHVDKPLRAVHSEERLPSGGSVPVPRKHRDGPGATQRKSKNTMTNSVTNLNSKEKYSKVQCESNIQNISNTDPLLPLDTEYGHASAPITLNGSFDCQELNGAKHSLDISNSDRSWNNNLEFDAFIRQDNMINESSAVDELQHVQPVYDQVKEQSKSWSLAKELFKLSKYGWYWGPITRCEAEDKLANLSDGAFLVRDSSDERYLLSLSFRSYDRTFHTRIEHCNGVFSFYAQLETEGYNSIVELIEHSMNDSQSGVFCYSRACTPGSPTFPVRLTKPVSRFTQVRSLQYLCRFVIRQYTRFDHIQRLPLPTTIKGWIEETQY